MTLELTEDEFNRFRRHITLAYNPLRTSSEKEAAILQAIKEHKSKGEIKRGFKTSYEVINRIKKQNGLGGI